MSRTKNKRRGVSKKEYLLSSKKCWLIEDKLLPVFSRLVESYSDELKDTWAVQVEESQFGSVQIKEEPADEINYDALMILQMHKEVPASSSQELQDFNEFNPSEDSPFQFSNNHQLTSFTGPIVDKEETHNNRKCAVCSKVFTRSNNLVKHMRSHSGENPYACSECDKRFSQKFDLNRHLLTHTGEKPYSCEHCSYTCAQRSTLNQHLTTHTGHKPHSCDVCGKSFARSRNLNQNKLTHTGEKKYKCEQCEKVFSWRGDLKRHIRTHTGEKPYRCDVCGKMFARSSARNKHTQQCTSTVTSDRNKE